MSIRDLTGQNFDRLTVIERDFTINNTNHRSAYWKCRCICDNTKTIRSDSLTGGRVRSCGCIKKEQDRINLEKNHSHKCSRTPLYWMWQHMKRRCSNPKDGAYRYYGARGITVCEEWENDSNSFIEWAMSNGYKRNLSIDRIDVNGNYEPSNCRFLDIKGQCNNRRSNILIEYQGETITLMQLSEKTGINYGTLSSRYGRHRLTGEDLIKPSGYYLGQRKGSLNNKTKLNEEQVRDIKRLLQNKSVSQAELSRRFNISTSVINAIYKNKTWKHVTV